MNPTIVLKEKTFELYLSEEEILDKIKSLAAQLNEDFKNQRPVFLVVLNGSVMLAADLLKEITIECDLSFVKLASYSGTQSSGDVRTLMGLHDDIKDRVVVVIEDIVDTGLTLTELMIQILKQYPKEIRVLTFLRKSQATKYHVQLDYIGFEVPNVFLVGYGLDINGQGRNLRDIYQLKK